MNKTNGIVIALLIILIGLVGYSIFKPKDIINPPTETPIVSNSVDTPLSTKSVVSDPNNSCKKNSDCSCKNFDGADFISGSAPGQCDLETNTCKTCYYR
jgi:hypothetical protein